MGDDRDILSGRDGHIRANHRVAAARRQGVGHADFDVVGSSRNRKRPRNVAESEPAEQADGIGHEDVDWKRRIDGWTDVLAGNAVNHANTGGLRRRGRKQDR
jgi:hypothetical protein